MVPARVDHEEVGAFGKVVLVIIIHDETGAEAPVRVLALDDLAGFDLDEGHAEL